MKIIPALLLATLLLGCGRSTPPHSRVKLASGKSVEVVSVGQVKLSAANASLVVRYRTELKFDNIDALSKEAIEVWQVFAPDAEKASLKNGIVTASTKGIGKERTFNFVFQKGPDGTWHTAQTGK